MERKSYIDRISSYGCKCEGVVANGSPRLQIKGRVAKQTFTSGKKNCNAECIVLSEISFQRLDEFILFYNGNRPHRYNGFKTPDCTEKCL